MRGGELLERVCENDYVTEHDITKYVKQILEGVKDMHEKAVLHLDLKVNMTGVIFEVFQVLELICKPNVLFVCLFFSSRKILCLPIQKVAISS